MNQCIRFTESVPIDVEPTEHESRDGNQDSLANASIESTAPDHIIRNDALLETKVLFTRPAVTSPSHLEL
jgi:hypothetical protein